jgi:hypothetical protein
MWDSPSDVSGVPPLAFRILKIINVEVKNYKKNTLKNMKNELKRNLRNNKRKKILSYTPKLI